MRANNLAKQPSTPKNWPHSTEEDLKERPQRIVNIGRAQDYIFPNNFVKTSKYEWYNFLPKFLFEEFRPSTKIANLYFLMIAILQCVPAITNTNGLPTTLIPLLFVVTVDGVFAALEDMARHKADVEANGTHVERYSIHNADFDNIKWADLNVGDFVKIYNREKIPADLVVLAVAEKTEPAQGLCYVETKSLDGETNLKLRQALPGTMSSINDFRQMQHINGVIEMEHPNKVIDSFTGVITIGEKREPIIPNNILLRGCVLRNTDWIIGCVINTGHHTKILMSATQAPNKSSHLENLATTEVKRMVILLFLICMIGSLGSVIWNKTYHIRDMYFFHWEVGSGEYWIIQFFYFFLLHATFVPVSLYVSMTLIRFIQATFMNNDLEMYYEKTDRPAMVRTMTLNEELGQISFIFSDKTGTLTCNIMDFRKMSVNGVSYGLGITEIGKASWKLQGTEIPDDILEGEQKAKEASVPHVSFYDPKYKKDMEKGGEQKDKIQQFFRVLSLCHDTIPERIDGSIRLSSSNPDDEALVTAAAYFGFSFCDKQENFAIIENKDKNAEEKYEILDIIEFSSKRKRMSVILRDPVDKKYKMMIKGADTVMIPRFKPGQDALFKTTDAHMKQYAIEGLRCLLIGTKEIDSAVYEDWKRRYSVAATNIHELDKKKKGLPNTIEELEDEIEASIELLGCTAIEDKLQDGVPECIADLARAGLKIWMLTGDKEETAINIAVACNLVLPKEFMKHVIINPKIAPDANSMHALLDNETKEIIKDETNFPRALIIDGPSLLIMMRDTEEGGLKSKLLDFSKLCKAVVGCRVSPDQKREMVNLIKTGVEGVRTLAIGDGANDVAMIQEAHIGVGIRGEEGLQAVNAADYAFSQFRFLKVLLLKHGRYNYLRMSNLIGYMFQKNVIMIICNFWFAWFNGFSGTKFYTEACVQFYNLIFTSLPILMYGFYDMDVPKDVVYTYPELYSVGMKNEAFTPRIFWTKIFGAIIDSIIITYVPMFQLWNHSHTGTLDSYMQFGALTYTLVILVVNTKVAYMVSNWTWLHFGAYVFSILSWFAIALGISNAAIIDFEFYQIFHKLLSTNSFWLSLGLSFAAVYVKDLYFILLRNIFDPKESQIILEARMIGTFPTRVANADDNYQPVEGKSQQGDEETGKVVEMKTIV